MNAPSPDGEPPRPYPPDRPKELTEEEHAWVREGTAAASRRGKLFTKVVENAALGIVWAVLCGLAYAAVEFFRMKLEAWGLSIPRGK